MANIPTSLVSKKKKKAVLIGTITGKSSQFLPEETLEELDLLVRTLGIEVVFKTLKRVRKINPAYFIGKGTLMEISNLAKDKGAEYIIFDERLSYSQIRNIANLTNLFVLDRPHVIIEIFEKRAKTREAKIQVELARLKMELPAIVGIGKSLDQQMGIVGIRGGPGEKYRELKRRTVEKKIKQLEKQLALIKKRRFTRRKLRNRSGIPIVSIVGYTNAGKTTLFNAITLEKAYTENMLFATLDTLVRKSYLKGLGREIIFVDTVGFIQKLPPILVSSFRSTLEEINDSHLILLTVDASNISYRKHIETVRKILKEILIRDIPIIIVYNKIDLLEDFQIEKLKDEDPEGIFVSALKGYGIEKLKERIAQILSGISTSAFKKV